MALHELNEPATETEVALGAQTRKVVSPESSHAPMPLLLEAISDAVCE